MGRSSKKIFNWGSSILWEIQAYFLKISRDFLLGETRVLEQNRIISVHYYLNSKIKTETMAYFFILDPNNNCPVYIPQTLPFYSSFNFPSSFYSMEHLGQGLSQTDLGHGSQLKNTPELPTVAPEQTIRSSAQIAGGRRKREKNLQRQMVSAKKNSQSNIINHFFTFFTLRESSEWLVRRTIITLGGENLETQKIVNIFYNIIRLINLKRGRKYINKVILCNYFSEEGLMETVEKKQSLEGVTFKQLGVVMRKCLLYFMREVSLTSILTSKRITKHSKEIHLNKRRKILNFLNGIRQNG